jgi:hypothetical protein
MESQTLFAKTWLFASVSVRGAAALTMLRQTTPFHLPNLIPKYVSGPILTILKRNERD